MTKNSTGCIKFSTRFMSAYRLGLLGRTALFAVKKYKSRRKVAESVLMYVETMP